MSLILEALNKAEQNQGASTEHNTPPPYLPERKSTPKWMVLLLVIATGLSSAAITFLIFYNTDSSNIQTATTVNNIDHQQPTQKQNTIPAYKASSTQMPTNKGAHKNVPLPKNNHLIVNREPNLHSLVTNSNHRSARKQISNKTDRHKENGSTKTATTDTKTDTYLDTQATNNKAEIKDIADIQSLDIAHIKIDVHMYEKAPDKRFVYINSVRHGEGSMISNGVFLNEITKNGIVINNNGTLYRVPIKRL